MYVLDKLWQGKLSPSEQCINADSEYSEIRHNYKLVTMTIVRVIQSIV